MHRFMNNFNYNKRLLRFLCKYYQYNTGYFDKLIEFYYINFAFPVCYMQILYPFPLKIFKKNYAC